MRGSAFIIAPPAHCCSVRRASPTLPKRSWFARSAERTRPRTLEGSIMSDSSLFEKGLKVRKEVLGEDYVNKSIAGADEFTRTMAEWSSEFCWGALWTRPGLDRRTRSIVNLAMLGALNRPHELKLHV